jgi:ankyrin repeat protein
MNKNDITDNIRTSIGVTSRFLFLVFVIPLTGCETNKLVSAAADGKLVPVRTMLSEGVNVNQRGSFDDGTALIAAARNGHVDVAKVLLENGADTEATNRFGETALMEASQANHCDVIHVLVENGADLEAKRIEQGRTALMHAANKRQVEAVEVLLALGANVNAKDKLGRTTLHWAIKAPYIMGRDYRPDVGDLTLMDPNAPRIVDILLNHGTDPNAREGNGKIVVKRVFGNDVLVAYGNTPLHCAVGYSQLQSVAEILLNRGVDVNVKNDYRQTPLMIAANFCTTNHVSIIKYLLEHGADVHVKDKYGQTALWKASHGDRYAGRDEVIRLLKQSGAKE